MREPDKFRGDMTSSGAASGMVPAAWLPMNAPRAHPTLRSVVLASLLGGGLGALAAATMFPALPALMFGAAIGAYSGFLATAMEALGSGDLPD
jgi:hypothetical protein